MRRIVLLTLILVFSFLEVFVSSSHCFLEQSCFKTSSFIASNDSADGAILKLDQTREHEETQSDGPFSSHGTCAVCGHGCAYQTVNNSTFIKPELSVYLAEFSPAIIEDVFLPILIRPPII